MPRHVVVRTASPKLGVIIGISAALAAITWLIFGQTLAYQFVTYDDPQYVYANPNVSAGLSLTGISWAFTHTTAGNWHPLTTISHMLDCQLYGLNATGHHFTNVLLHMITVILLFLLLRQMTGNLWRSGFVAALFAVHPLHVESVAWIAERKDVLSAFFFMLTLWTYAKYVRSGESRGSRENDETRRPKAEGSPKSKNAKPLAPRAAQCAVWYLFALTLFALGLMSKPMLVTTPFVLLLLDFWPLNRLELKTKNLKLKTVFPLVF